MELKTIENEITCPRCGKAKVLEVYMDGRPSSFQCLNPDKKICGFKFQGEIRHNFEKRQVEFWGVAENPAYNNDNKTFDEGIMFVGGLLQKGVPMLLNDEAYLFRAKSISE
jgi:hypothetical protein